MNTREKLDEIKRVLNIKTDAELSMCLGTNKSNIDSWVKRNKIPAKWELAMGQKSDFLNIAGNNNVQILGNNNPILRRSFEESDYDELFQLIKQYATPKIIGELKEKLLRIKKIHEE